MDVSFNNYVKTQGWSGSSLYATWHTFIGLKKDSDTIYIIGMKTTTYNMVTTSEVYKKFKDLGMYDVIKLDGGGSFYMNVNGSAVASTWENRHINTIICFDESNGGNKTSTSTSTSTATTANKTVVNTTSNKSNATNNTTTATNNKVTTTTATKKSNLSSTIKNVKNTIRNKYRRINGFRFLRAK